METAITHGIKISVESKFNEVHSEPVRGKFIYEYWISIENKSEFTVQLLRRHWLILDSNNLIKEVEGEGVIGEQPVLKPGQIHKYSSWCPLSSEIGKMKGTYLMVRLLDNQEFHVNIPEFKLIAPYKLN